MTRLELQRLNWWQRWTAVLLMARRGDRDAHSMLEQDYPILPTGTAYRAFDKRTCQHCGLRHLELQRAHYHVTMEGTFNGSPDKCPYCSTQLKQANRLTRQRFMRMRAASIRNARGGR